MAALSILGADYQPILSPGMQCRVTAQSSAAGAINVVYPLDAVRADRLSVGLIVRARVSGDTNRSKELAPYVLNDFEVDRSKRQLVGVWSGVQHAGDSLRKTDASRGVVGGHLDETIFYGTPGRFAEALKQFADARSSLLHVAFTSTALLDSQGRPWTVNYPSATEGFKMPPGSSGLDLLRLLVEDDGCEWDIVADPPDGFTPDPDAWSYVRIYNVGGMGRDHTSVPAGQEPMTITLGQAAEAPLNQSGYDYVRRVTAVNDDGLAVVVFDDTVTGDYDMPEVTIKIAGTLNAARLQRRAARYMRQVNHIATEQTIKLDLTSPKDPVPGLDLDVGHYLFTQGDSQHKRRRRVHSWALDLDVATGKTTGSITLDTVLHTKDVRTYTALRDLERGLRGFGLPSAPGIGIGSGL